MRHFPSLLSPLQQLWLQKTLQSGICLSSQQEIHELWNGKTDGPHRKTWKTQTFKSPPKRIILVQRLPIDTELHTELPISFLVPCLKFKRKTEDHQVSNTKEATRRKGTSRTKERHEEISNTTTPPFTCTKWFYITSMKS